MAKNWRSKSILAKIETSYGTDPTPTGTANAILALNVSFSPMEGEDVVRNLERPYFGANPTVVAAERAVLSFDVELVGSGSLGVVPGWGPLIRGCGVAQVITASTKVEYTPITDNPESLTFYFDVDGTQHIMLGSRGTTVFKLGANGIPTMSFAFTGLALAVSEQAKPTVDFSAFQSPQTGSTANTPTFTIGGTTFVLRDYSLDLGNDVQYRGLIGSSAVRIVDRQELLKTSVEAVAVSTYNPITVARSAAPQAIVLAHGTVAGRRVRIDVASAVQQRLSGYDNQQNILEWPLSFVPQPTAGNDQWKITLT